MSQKLISAVSRALPCASDSQNGVERDCAMVSKARPMSPETGDCRKFAVMSVTTAN